MRPKGKGMSQLDSEAREKWMECAPTAFNPRTVGTNNIPNATYPHSTNTETNVNLGTTAVIVANRKIGAIPSCGMLVRTAKSTLKFLTHQKKEHQNSGNVTINGLYFSRQSFARKKNNRQFLKAQILEKQSDLFNIRPMGVVS